MPGQQHELGSLREYAASYRLSKGAPMSCAQKITILHSAVPENAPAEELDTLNTARVISDTLRSAGHSVSELPFSLDLEQLRSRLLAQKPDLVINLVESVAGQGRGVFLAPYFLETLSIPFTGSNSQAIFLTTDKLLTKQILQANGLPTPRWAGSASELARQLDPQAQLIVKPRYEDASIAITQDSVKSAAAVLAQERPEASHEFFAEQFIAGREINVSLLERDKAVLVLPIPEIEFKNYPPGLHQIMDYQAKWIESSFEYENTVRRFLNATAESSLYGRLTEIALNCWKVCELSGYARIDLRIDADGNPWVLEVNANPSLDPYAGLAASAHQSDISYAELLQLIVAAAAKGAF